MVKVRGEKVIIKMLDTSDDSWFYEYLRGLLYIHWPYTDDEDPNLDLDRKWDYTRLIAVFLVPPSFIAERIRRAYVYDWKQQIHLPNNFERKLDLHRIYQTLRLHSRNKTLELLGNFLYKVYDPNSCKPFISQFHFSLFDHLNHPYDANQIELIVKGLDTQDLRVMTLAKLMPQYSTSKIFTIWKQVETHLSTFVFPCRRILGLYKLYIFGTTLDQKELLKEFPFFESFEEFEEEKVNFVKARIASNSVTGLYENVSSLPSNQRLLLVLPDTSVFRISPEMFDPNNQLYHSVNCTKAKILHIREDQKLPVVNQSALTEDEVHALRNLLVLQDDNPVNNYGEFSQDQTKKLIHSLKSKSAYFPLVLIRKSSLLRTGVLILPLSEYLFLDQFHLCINDLGNPVKLHHLLSHVPPETLKMDQLEELQNLSWPYMTIDFGIQFEPSQEHKMQIVALVRISCNMEDMDFLLSLAKSHVIGIQFYNQGSAPIIPVKHFRTGEWDYPLDKLLDILS